MSQIVGHQCHKSSALCRRLSAVGGGLSDVVCPLREPRTAPPTGRLCSMLLSNSSSSSMQASAPEEASRHLEPGYQLGFLLLAVVASVPPVWVARDIVTSRRRRRQRLSPLDELLLLRVLVICALVPYSVCFVLVREPAQRWLTPLGRHVACTVHSLIVVVGLGVVVNVNFLISLSRVQQLMAASGAVCPALSARLTAGWLRWQARLLIALLSGVMSAVVLLLGVPPSSYYWCCGLPEPAKPPMNVLLTINSGLNFATFALCVFLLRAGYRLRATACPWNYIPALSWAQLCLSIITANAVLAPLNVGKLNLEEKTYLNHSLFTLIYGLLDPCLLLLMASRWRQQVREYRLQAARARNARQHDTNRVIPEIRLDLI